MDLSEQFWRWSVFGLWGALVARSFSGGWECSIAGSNGQCEEPSRCCERCNGVGLGRGVKVVGCRHGRL